MSAEMLAVLRQPARLGRAPNKLRRFLVTSVVAGALGSGLVPPATAAPRRCNRPEHSQLLASNAVGSVWSLDANEDPEYGGPVSVFSCLKSRPRTRHRLMSYPTGFAVTFTRVRLTGSRVSWHEAVTDVACSKYSGSGCSQERDAAYSLRSGRPVS